MGFLQAELLGALHKLPQLLQAGQKRRNRSDEAEIEGEAPVVAFENVSLGNCGEDDTLKYKKQS